MVAGETLLDMSGSKITALRLLPDVESTDSGPKIAKAPPRFLGAVFANGEKSTE